MTYKVGGYHRGTVVAYYLELLIRFGPTALRRHLPQLKKVVWSKKGLALVERHKLKRANQEWSA
jgi:hypothetical protein